MNIKLLILSTCVFIVSSIFLYRHYNQSDQKALYHDIETANKLIKSGMTATAVYDTVYRKYRDFSSIDYFFEVNHHVYKGSKVLPNSVGVQMPSGKFKLVYLPSDPNIHGEDPENLLKADEAALHEKSSPTIPWVLFATSIIVFYFTRKTYLRELREQRELDAVLKSNVKL